MKQRRNAAEFERGENVAQMIMRRSSVLERPEPAQERQLLLTEPRDFGERFAARQNRQKAQEQDFVERIDHLPGLPTVRHIFEVLKENRRFGHSREILSNVVHKIPHKANQRISTNSASHRVVTNFFTRLPWTTGGHHVTFPEFYAKVLTDSVNVGLVNYSLSWRRFASVFGRDSLRLVSFNNLIDSGIDLFEHFCEVILGLTDVPKVDKRLIVRNARPDAIRTEVIRALNFLYFKETSRTGPTMRKLFDKQIQGSYDLRTIEGHLETDLREFQIDDGSAHLRSTWDTHLRSTWDAISAYQDRLVSPEYGEEFFGRRTARLQYVGQNYLFRKGAADELMKIYKWVGTCNSSANGESRIG